MINHILDGILFMQWIQRIEEGLSPINHERIYSKWQLKAINHHNGFFPLILLFLLL